MVAATVTTRKVVTTTHANVGAKSARSTAGTKMRTRPAKRGRSNDGSGSGRSANVGSGSQSAGQPAPGNRPCNATLELMAQQWEAAKAAAKLHYTEADRIEQEIIEAVGVGGLLPLSDGRTLRVKDNFRDAAGNPKIKAYSMAGVKLCEIEVK